MSNKKNSSGVVGYSGTITVSAKIGNSTIKQYVYKNSGTLELFKFFCYCLKGDYATGEQLRPSKIKLFYNNDSSFDNAKQSPFSNSDGSTVTPRSSGFITYNTLPTLSWDSATNTCTTTFHFMIPNALLTLGSNNSVDGYNQINQICLYQQDARDEENCLAYFLFSNSDNDEFAPLTVENDKFNLMIDWEMTLMNAAPTDSSAQ